MESVPYILTIDIGQTSSALWITTPDLSRSAFRELAGFRHHIESARTTSGSDLGEAIARAIAAMLAELNCTSEQVTTAWCSVSGAPPDLKERLTCTLPRADVHLVADSEAAYLGTLWRTPGITLIGGTGTVAFGRNGEKRAVVGGWGYLFGDVGAAWGLARAGVMAGIAAWEGRGPETELMPQLLDMFDVDSYRTLVAKVYTGELRRSQLGQAAPLVVRAAEAGDAVAMDILRSAATEYAGYIRSGAAQLELGTEVQVGYAGGVLSGAALLRQAIDEAVQFHGLRVARWVPGSSLTGVARCAFEAVGVPMTQDRLDALLEATVGLKRGKAAPEADAPGADGHLHNVM